MYLLATLADLRHPAVLRTSAAYVLAVFLDGNPRGQDLSLDAGLVALALAQLQADYAPLRRMVALMLAKASRDDM